MSCPVGTDPRLIDKMLWNWAVIQDKATQNLCKSLPKEKAVSQLLPLPLHLFLVKRNDLFLLLYHGVIVVMRGCFCWRWDSWWLIEEKKGWATRRRVSTIPRVLGEMASHGRMLWSARLLPAVVGKFVFSSTGFIWFQIWWKQCHGGGGKQVKCRAVHSNVHRRFCVQHKYSLLESHSCASPSVS